MYLVLLSENVILDWWLAAQASWVFGYPLLNFLNTIWSSRHWWIQSWFTLRIVIKYGSSSNINLTSVWRVRVLGMVTIFQLPLAYPCLTEGSHSSPRFCLQHCQFLHSLGEMWEDPPTKPIPFTMKGDSINPSPEKYITCHVNISAQFTSHTLEVPTLIKPYSRVGSWEGHNILTCLPSKLST